MALTTLILFSNPLIVRRCILATNLNFFPQQGEGFVHPKINRSCQDEVVQAKGQDLCQEERPEFHPPAKGGLDGVGKKLIKKRPGQDREERDQNVPLKNNPLQVARRKTEQTKEQDIEAKDAPGRQVQTEAAKEAKIYTRLNPL